MIGGLADMAPTLPGGARRRESPTVELGGNGAATVTVQDRLDVTIDGSGPATCCGGPTVVRHSDRDGQIPPGPRSIAANVRHAGDR